MIRPGSARVSKLSVALAAAVPLMAAACASNEPAPLIDRTAKPQTATVFQAPAEPRAIPPVPGAKPIQTSPGARYVARRGDSVYRIARRYGLPLRDLLDANALSAPYRLAIGRTLLLPPPRRHRVVAGDTISGLARAYDVSPGHLVAVNRLRAPYTIVIGRQLVLPATIQRPATTRRPATTKAPARPPPATRVAGGPPIPTAKPRRRAPAVKRAAVTRPPRRAGGRFAWPVRGRVISRYGAKPGGLYNDGINIAAGLGTAVRAAENGVVAYVGNELRGFGNLLLIRHAEDWMTAYAHASRITVRTGDRVRRGQLVARVGRTGDVDRTQLHFELRRGKSAVNPMKYMARRAKVRLGPGVGRSDHPAPPGGSPLVAAEFRFPGARPGGRPGPG